MKSSKLSLMNIESSVIFCFDLKKNISKKNAKKKKENKKKLTRPDTWPIPVANGWAGAETKYGFLISQYQKCRIFCVN